MRRIVFIIVFIFFALAYASAQIPCRGHCRCICKCKIIDKPAIEIQDVEIAQNAKIAESPDTLSDLSSNLRPLRWSVQTNMLYDAVAVPNVGLEFVLSPCWSVAGNWMYGWWSSNSHHRYWRVYGGMLTTRYWLKKREPSRALRGHHFGLYGQVYTYDFEWGGKGYMAGKPGGDIFDRASYSFGIEYGFMLPIKRRLSIDFSICLGYAGGSYLIYRPKDGCYAWESTRQRHWVGPTNLAVTLVWQLGEGNVNWN